MTITEDHIPCHSIHYKDLKTIVELSDDCPCALQPSNTLSDKIQLNKHQLASLYRCQQFERKKIRIIRDNQNQNEKSENNNIIENDDTDFITTQFGIIGDQTGSGKSYVILSLIAARVPPERDERFLTWLCNGKLVINKESKNYRFMKTNLLIIPSHLCYQWSNYIKQFLPPTIRSTILSNRRQLLSFIESGIDSYDIAVMTPVFYKHFHSTFTTDEFSQLCFERVFVDEVETVSTPPLPRALFHWYVTASVNNLIYPYGTPDMNVAGLSTGYNVCGTFKNEMKELSHSPLVNASAFVVRNSSLFIRQSIRLPPISYRKLRCATPSSINILNGLVDNHVIRCLNANDLKGAMSFYGVRQQFNKEDDIVDILVEKFRTNISNIDRQIEFINSGFLTFDSEEEKQNNIQGHQKKKEDLEKKIASIQARISGSNACNICFESFEEEEEEEGRGEGREGKGEGEGAPMNAVKTMKTVKTVKPDQIKTVVSCCSNAFCFVCINKWVSKSNRCPICKSVVAKENILILNQTCESVRGLPASQRRMADKNGDYIDEEASILSTNTKMENLQNIIRHVGPRSKILIFSQYDFTFDLPRYLCGLHYATPRGHKESIHSLVTSFKTGALQILLLNPSHFGSGLNLENTTDVIMLHKLDSEIEKQVIGRAQRYGRTSPLRVWYLLHENEMVRHENQVSKNGAGDNYMRREASHVGHPSSSYSSASTSSTSSAALASASTSATFS